MHIAQYYDLFKTLFYEHPVLVPSCFVLHVYYIYVAP